jgi:4-alpha-glucanotransferase
LNACTIYQINRSRAAEGLNSKQKPLTPNSYLHTKTHKNPTAREYFQYPENSIMNYSNLSKNKFHQQHSEYSQIQEKKK